MLRPSRQAKQRPIQSHEIVGILPSEEAAISRALYASYYGDKKRPASKPKDDTTTPPTAKSSSKFITPPHKKLKLRNPSKVSDTSPKLSNTFGNYERIASRFSRSPRSSSSTVSFLSSESLSSSLWTPTSQTTPPLESKSKRKSTAKRKSPKKAASTPKGKQGTKKAVTTKLKSKITSGKEKMKMSSMSKKSTKTKTASTMKSIHKTKTKTHEKAKRKTKLLACAVRKKAELGNDEVPRDMTGNTVDEILMVIARLSKRKETKSKKSNSTSPKSISLSSTPRSKIRSPTSSSKNIGTKPSPKCTSPNTKTHSKADGTPGKGTAQKNKIPNKTTASSKYTPKLSPKSKTTPTSGSKPDSKSKIKSRSPAIGSKSGKPTSKGTPKSCTQLKTKRIAESNEVSGFLTPNSKTDVQQDGALQDDGQSSRSPGAASADSALSKCGEEKLHCSSERQSPNSYYQAQRKFASNHTPPARPSYHELASPQELKETPKTEEFINFLCLRGSGVLPEQYRKFDLPWTPIKQDPDKSGGQKGGNGRANGKSSSSNRDRSSALLNMAAKKLDFNTYCVSNTVVH